jgi:hypothetical protein
MIFYHREADGVYTITKNAAVYAWATYSRKMKQWKVVTTLGTLSHHYSLDLAIRSIAKGDI